MRARRIIEVAALGLALGVLVYRRERPRGGELPPRPRGDGPVFRLSPEAYDDDVALSRALHEHIGGLLANERPGIGLGQGGMVFAPYDEGPEPGTCDLSPDGWMCARDRGHKPPCALWPTQPPNGYAETRPGVWTDPSSDYEWRPFPPHFL